MLKKKKRKARKTTVLSKTVKLTTGTIGLRVASSVAATVPRTAGVIARGAVGLSSLGLLKEAAKELK